MYVYVRCIYIYIYISTYVYKFIYICVNILQLSLKRKSCDYRDNHIQQKSVIVLSEKLKTSFRINPTSNM